MLGARSATLAVAALALVLLAPAASAQQDQEEFQGTVSGPGGDPVAGVTIVATQDGAQVGEATTGQDGSGTVTVPGPGEYDVRLVTDSLPEGIVPRSSDEDVRSGVSLTPGQSRTLLFPLTTPAQQQAGDDQSPGSSTQRPPG